ncbi:serum amyloid A-2 protein [Rhipicephalus microplus]|uniref:serum amyloid A-2 protein n=1 Tax=Rhipicephalus microplus TaxID=6941 RepID=UPI001888776D|nr:serum amyloid A-2 protein-like [Rhipicephalus microplus]
MRSPTLFCLLLLVVSSVTASELRKGRSIFGMAACVTRNAAVLIPYDGRCAAGKLQAAYSAMSDANCVNCDKYFHCIGNFRAVTECGNSEEARNAAEVISNCREEAGGTDSAADQEANEYGRGGGDCAHRYLAAVGCAYNPDTKTCG